MDRAFRVGKFRDHSEFSNRPAFDKAYDRLQTCPHCGIGTDGKYVAGHAFRAGDKDTLMILTWSCTSCLKIYLTGYRLSTGSDKAQLEIIYPNIIARQFDERIENRFHRYVELYNQAHTAEQNGHEDLAGMGYRAALEFLITDALSSGLITPLKEWDETKIIFLGTLIKDYLPPEYQTSAFVANKIGSSYVHLKEKQTYETIEILKSYIHLFEQKIILLLMEVDPPVRPKT